MKTRLWLVLAILGIAATALAAALLGSNPGRAGARDSGLPAVWHSDIAYCARSQLARIDPDTLERVPGERLTLRDDLQGPTLSPDRSEAALDGTGPARIVLADVRRMRRLGTVRLDGYDDARTIAWPLRRRIVALDVSENVHWVGRTDAVVIDPVAHSVRRVRFQSWGEVGHGTTRSGYVAILLVSWGRLSAPRLLVVGPRGRIRQVALDRVVAGVGYDSPDEIRRFPALAIDPARDRAIVVDEGEPVAEVDLRTMAVGYHDVAGLAVPARALAGPRPEHGHQQSLPGPATPRSLARRRARRPLGLRQLLRPDGAARPGRHVRTGRAAAARHPFLDSADRRSACRRYMGPRFPLRPRPDPGAHVGLGCREASDHRVEPGRVRSPWESRLSQGRDPDGALLDGALRPAVPRGSAPPHVQPHRRRDRTLGWCGPSRVEALDEGYC